MSTKNKLPDLRNHLFATLEALQDNEDPMDVDRAKAVAKVAEVLIKSAKIEIDFIRALGRTQGTGFIPEEPRSIKEKND